MIEAYTSGDPYLEFAKQAGAVPLDATKQSHPAERSRFKECALGVQYGMGEDLLAFKLGVSPAEARNLLQLHRQTYRRYWAWNDDLVNSSLLGGILRTVFGWNLHPTDKPNALSVGNWPMQSHGSELMRLACCMVTERGITVCAPVHDAILVMAETDRIEQVVRDTQALMAEASTIVLGGRLTLRSDAKIFGHPERYSDERGTEMWETVTGILEELGAIRPEATGIPDMQAPVSALNAPAILS
jgi:DNA polymerase I-like protein with 3'-5' exonuclease and polymerase domains